MDSEYARRMRVSRLAALLVALLLLVGSTVPAQAQSSKSYHWTQYDYTVDILENGDMVFDVTMTFSFDSGSFSVGYFAFDMDRLDDVQDVQVYEGSEAYSLVRSERVGGYQVTKGDEFEVEWYFPPTSNAERTFTLVYRVLGGLRIYDEGDQFYWNFYAGDRSASIDSGLITVRFPSPIPVEDLQAAVDPSDVALVQVDDTTLQARVTDLGGNQAVVLRVQFPHGLVDAEMMDWQVSEDKTLAYEENTKPWVDLLILGLSILFLVGGAGGVVALWYTRGRDAPVGVVAEYISEPPSDLPPGLAGALVDEKVDVQDILATIVDLGRRGVLSMEENQEPGLLGIGTKTDFTYRRLAGEHKLSGYESRLVTELFGKKSQVELSALKNTFYSSIPKISKPMYEDLTDRGYFTGNPEKTRSRWIGIGVSGLAVIFFAFICLSAAVSKYSDTYYCLPLGAAVPFLLLAIMGPAMPKKTEKGATEAAGWEAFKRYLQDISRFDKLEEKVAIFERYLPYAIALGVEKEYLERFSQVQAPTPTWYLPYRPVILPGSLGRPAGGSTSTSQTSGSGGGLASLQGMSDGMSSSLQGMSNGLQSMLNSAANTMTSRPRSSGGGGGGGWSGGGGGFGGGGGGGGGSGAR